MTIAVQSPPFEIRSAMKYQPAAAMTNTSGGKRVTPHAAEAATIVSSSSARNEMWKPSSGVSKSASQPIQPRSAPAKITTAATALSDSRPAVTRWPW